MTLEALFADPPLPRDLRTAAQRHAVRTDAVVLAALLLQGGHPLASRTLLDLATALLAALDAAAPVGLGPVALPLAVLLATPARTPAETRAGAAPDKRPGRSPVITARDGTRLSVQANEGCYCTPQDNDGPWTAVEVATFGDAPAAWRAYFVSDHLYGYVPAAAVRAYLDQHGGEVA